MTAKKIKDIGELNGDVAAFGGPYSNFQATCAMLDEAARRGVPSANLICTGDAVAYCADPADVVAALYGVCHWVAGNVEMRLASGAEDCGCGFVDGSLCDRLAPVWYAYARGRLDDAAFERLRRCPDIVTFRNRGRSCAVIHGGVSDVSAYLWPTSQAEDFQREIAALEALCGRLDVVFAGHSGIAFQRRFGPVVWVNAGAIGLPPDDGRPEGRYAVLGAVGVRFERLIYDAETAAERMRAAGLPEEYARALTTGWWPDEAILPLELRQRG